MMPSPPPAPLGTCLLGGPQACQSPSSGKAHWEPSARGMEQNREHACCSGTSPEDGSRAQLLLAGRLLPPADGCPAFGGGGHGAPDSTGGPLGGRSCPVSRSRVTHPTWPLIQATQCLPRPLGHLPCWWALGWGAVPRDGVELVRGGTGGTVTAEVRGRGQPSQTLAVRTVAGAEGSSSRECAVSCHCL